MIESIELRLIRMELAAPFETSFSIQTDRQVLLAALSDGQYTGWGECTAGNDPFYSGETTAGCLQIIRDFIIPGLRDGRIRNDPQKYYESADYIRGNEMARATVESALWDLESQRRQVPLHRLLGGTRPRLETGVSVGIQKNIDTLVSVVRDYSSAGYQRIKIKIKPGWDIEPVEAIRNRLGEVPLMVDANCAYSPGDIDTLRKFDRFELMMIEQPFSPDDFADHADLQQQIETPVCLDESIESVDAVRTAIALKSCRIINIKQGRVGGITAAVRIHDLCQRHGIPVWAGGMLETGIGRSHNIALASLENFSLPGDISASDRYWHRDIISPHVRFERPGELQVPASPGRGFEVDMESLDSLTIHKETHKIG